MTVPPRYDDRDDAPIAVRESFSLRDLVQIVSVVVGATVFLVFAIAKTNSVEAVMQTGFVALRAEVASMNALLAQHIAQEDKITATLDERQRAVADRVTTIEAKQSVLRDRLEAEMGKK